MLCLAECSPLFTPGVVHEHPRIGSDGESEEGSGTSDDPNVSPGSEELATNGKQVSPPPPSFLSSSPPLLLAS